MPRKKKPAGLFGNLKKNKYLAGGGVLNIPSDPPNTSSEMDDYHDYHRDQSIASTTTTNSNNSTNTNERFKFIIIVAGRESLRQRTRPGHIEFNRNDRASIYGALQMKLKDEKLHPDLDNYRFGLAEHQKASSETIVNYDLSKFDIKSSSVFTLEQFYDPYKAKDKDSNTTPSKSSNKEQLKERQSRIRTADESIRNELGNDDYLLLKQDMKTYSQCRYNIVK